MQRGGLSILPFCFVNQGADDLAPGRMSVISWPRSAYLEIKFLHNRATCAEIRKKGSAYYRPAFTFPTTYAY